MAELTVVAPHQSRLRHPALLSHCGGTAKLVGNLPRAAPEHTVRSAMLPIPASRNIPG